MRKDWAELDYKDIVKKITINTKKIKQKEYLQNGVVPVIDQGQELIGGYTDDETKIVDCKLPVIVFGDHTKIVKLINFPFAPGADGVKVLELKYSFEPKLLKIFTEVIALKIKDKGYARHYQDIEKSKMPLPSLLEQKAIVSKIEQLFSELDNGIENLKVAQQKLKIYRQAVLKKAFEGELTKEWREKQTNLPTASKLLETLNNHKYELGYKIKNKVTNWEYYPIGNICSFQQGMQIAKAERLKEFNDETLPILRIKNYRDGFKSDVEYIVVNEQSLIADKEDLIVTRTGESRGDILTGYKGVFHNNTFRLNYNDEIFTRSYLLYYLNFSEVQNYIKFVSGKTGQPDLTHRNFGPCPIIIPSLNEQNQLVQEIESRLSVCDNIEATISDNLQKSEALRHSILKKAFEGKLLTEIELENIKSNPEYESAEKLLERIKQERDK